MKQQHLLFLGLVSLFACHDASGPPDTSNRQHWIALSTGVYHSCGVTADGSAFCWGLNPSGALGNGDAIVASVRPVRVLTDLRFTSISVGGEFSCGLTTANRAYCWGGGFGGALGDGNNTSSAIPVAVADDHVFTQISVGFQHVCALIPAGEAYCWGDNLFGELGDGTNVRRSIPTLVVSSIAFKSISAGNLQTCALSIQGKAFCWGGSSYGEVGVACDTVLCGWPTPQPVSGDLTFVSISAGILSLVASPRPPKHGAGAGWIYHGPMVRAEWAYSATVALVAARFRSEWLETISSPKWSLALAPRAGSRRGVKHTAGA
jgi:alpha-tubulin suppressor-like RCC1 family protein